ncbi:MAG: hypothetical protein ACP5PS_09765 [Bacteroidales bacterium]
MKIGILFIAISYAVTLQGISLDSLSLKVRRGSINEQKEALKTLAEYYQDKDSAKCFFLYSFITPIGC